ncbi:hypothetical protein I5R28_18700 [Serratia marcescens]|nr:hypothetical protein [Serratia marcescens]
MAEQLSDFTAALASEGFGKTTTAEGYTMKLQQSEKRLSGLRRPSGKFDYRRIRRSLRNNAKAAAWPEKGITPEQSRRFLGYARKLAATK